MTRKSVLFTTLYSVKHDTEYVWVGSQAAVETSMDRGPVCLY
jgi:hypothetical protein